MDKSNEIKKTVLDGARFKKVIDNSFSTFILPVTNTTDDIAEFFRLYEELFYTMDVLGIEDSHEYLVRKSSELLDFDKETLDIQPLLDEIAQLRQENLSLSQQILTLQTQV